MSRQLRTVAIDSLRLPGDWRARLDSHGVKEMAKSGPIHQPPAIVKATREVIFGGDRLAAMHLRGEAEAEVWVYDDLGDDDITEMRLVENIFRRHDNRDFHLAALVALREKRIVAGDDLPPLTQEANSGQTDHPAPDAPEPGRPKTPRGLAREQVAAAAGITTEAVRSAEKRAAAADREVHDDGPAPAQDSPASPGLAESLALDELDRLLMAAVKSVTRLAKEFPALVERFPVQDLKWKLQREVAPGFRAMRPQDRCPFCKCWPGVIELCPACKGSGWIAMDMLNGIPKELLAKGKDEGIFVEGKFVTLKALAEAGTKKATKKLTSAMLRTPPPVPADRATRTVLEVATQLADDFSDAWTEDER
jgi:hypothetical protein